MEQFSLEKYLANPSRKVVTRDGRNVKIISTDMNCKNYPIVALVQISDKYYTEKVNIYTEDGELDIERPYSDDLFFASEKHEGWINVYRNNDSHTYAGAVYDSKEDAEKRKIIDENYVTTIKIEWEE